MLPLGCLLLKLWVDAIWHLFSRTAAFIEYFLVFNLTGHASIYSSAKICLFDAPQFAYFNGASCWSMTNIF